MELLSTPRTLLDGLTMVESARWHDGRLWFAHWGAGEVVAVDLDGTAEVIAPGPDGMGWSLEWLPDGRLVTTGQEITVHGGGATRSTWSAKGGNEIVVHPRGHVYVNWFEFDFLGGGMPEPGWIRRIDPDGTATQVADDIHFPNGMVLTPDGSTLVVAESMAARLTAFDVADDGSLGNRRVWAEGLSPDGICIDAARGIWAQAPTRPARASACECSREERSRTASRPSCRASPARSADRTGRRCSCCATSSRAWSSWRACWRGGPRGS